MYKAYIGLDVHKDQITIAIAFSGNDEPVSYGRCPSDINRFVATLRKLMKKYELEKKDVLLCYEAGPTGFALARHLLRLKFAIQVIAPSLIPKKSGEKIKTDRRDAKKLARYLRSGDLTFVYIPDVIDETIRDLCRARTDSVSDRTQNRQRLKSLLLRHGHSYTACSSWTEAHKRYLRELVLNDPIQKLVLEEYLSGVDSADQRVINYEDYMKDQLTTWARRPLVEALQGFKGFQLVASMILISEIGDFLRFDHPRKLMAYLGLVPTEETSDKTRHQGAITKCGNSHARWILVEVARHYAGGPKVSKELSKRQEGLHGDLKQISWNAQLRLYKRYKRLTMRKLHPNKVKVAVARELVAFIWEMAHRVETLEAQVIKTS
jgi:transposase